MAEAGSTKTIGLAVVAALLALAIGWRACAKGKSPDASSSARDTEMSSSGAPPKGAIAASGLSAPIAAARLADGDVVVAALDATAKTIRVQRIGVKDQIVAERSVLPGVAWSTDSDLKVSAGPGGLGVIWRGLREGKLVRQLVVLQPDLTVKGEPAEVSAASCGTRDALWFSDGAKVTKRSWTGAVSHAALPKDRDASLLCGSTRAYAVFEEDESTSILALGEARLAPVAVMREADFGDDEQHELSEYTVGQDVGFVRLGASGALAVREVVMGSPGPLHTLKTRISKDDDIVAVDASANTVVIVFSRDASAACPPSSPSDNVVSTKVLAVRVDRRTFEESTVELSPGRCAFEVGPFFTGVVGDDVSVAWVERTGGVGRPRAPIAGLAHVRVAAAGAPAVQRIAQAADALVDSGCDGTECFAAALVRRDGADAPASGIVRILRYR